MITKYTEYIKEGVNDNIIIYYFTISFYTDNNNNHFTYNSNDDSYSILSKRIKNIVKNKYSRFTETFKLDKITKNRFIFYLKYVLNIEYRITHDIIKFYIKQKTIIEILNIFKSFFKKNIDNEIEKYIDNNGVVDDMILNCLNDKQKVKYKHLIDAKNFDLI